MIVIVHLVEEEMMESTYLSTFKLSIFTGASESQEEQKI